MMAALKTSVAELNLVGSDEDKLQIPEPHKSFNAIRSGL